jgi:hypothetical protein
LGVPAGRQTARPVSCLSSCAHRAVAGGRWFAGGGAGGQGEGVISFYPMPRTIADASVEIVGRVRLAGGDNGHVRLEGIFGEPGRSIVADHLVTWNGGEPDLALSAQLNALGVEHTIIGDAVRPRRFADATAEAKSSTDAWKPVILANADHAPL